MPNAMLYSGRLATILGLALLLALPATADTITLKNGVEVHGNLREIQPGVFQLETAGRVVVYRADEVARIEENDRTGGFDIEAAKERARQRDAELTEQTGLTKAQRDHVREMLHEYRGADAARRTQLLEQFKEMQQEVDVFRYIVFYKQALSNNIVPPALDALYTLDPLRSRTVLAEYAQDSYYGNRAKALQLLGHVGDTQYVPLVMRGLADHELEVQAQAAVALARLGVREATPAILEVMQRGDVHTRHAAAQALAALWRDVAGEAVPDTPNAWAAFVSEHQQEISGPVRLAALEPLVAPHEEFEQE